MKKILLIILSLLGVLQMGLAQSVTSEDYY